MTHRFAGFLILLSFLLILPLSCKGDKDKVEEYDPLALKTPEMEQECLSGKCVDGQWQTSFQRFAIVIGNGVNLRPQPKVNTKILAQFPITRKITVLHVNPEEEIIGGLKGRWAFVRDTKNIKLRGWLFDHFIGYQKNFKKVDSWEIKRIREILGHQITTYTCTPDGKFSMEKERNWKKVQEATGEIWRSKDIIWLKKDTPDDYPAFFLLTKDGKLDFQDQYRDKGGRILVK